jgi:tripartite-type tricarboxylate transporter receptor subunit TctC
MRTLRAVGLLFAALFLAGSAARAEYPEKTIRIVVPYPPGGFNDTLGRIVAQKLGEAWGQPTMVENRPGGGTLIGTDAVAKAPPSSLIRSPIHSIQNISGSEPRAFYHTPA